MAQIFKSQQMIPAQYVPVFLENPDVQESIHSESSESIILCPKMVWTTESLDTRFDRQINAEQKNAPPDPSHALLLRITTHLLSNL